ncbi:YmdB family metallophosphoesterase [Telmatocola sphagniphila]|uniref:YmdB family metallophosphoesterase n=1 Tax=Telmatocola sphagniphila TaxID=1123043 RepID=A0A8E6BA09_9BACT|nr:TIGR00282 family metallophosphoesterase [Telmatocola sphagniphila]QVL34632.1 YmdB family metallophosphoesterase [Telmatocola sphagniphila]
MRLLFIGDIVGTPGLKLIKQAVPALRAEQSLDFVIANAENVASGSGMYPSNFHALRRAGVDGLTMGDHVFRRPDILPILTSGEPVVKPANFPSDAPGKNFAVLKNERGHSLAIVSLLGRLFMKAVDCPLRTLDLLLPEIRKQTTNILVDFHAEATGEKYQARHYFAGRVSAIVGTHTHVVTADAQVTPEGTAYISDVGMTGGHAGILGRKAKPIVEHALNMIPTNFDVEEEDPRMNGVLLEIDENTGKALSIQQIEWTQQGSQLMPLRTCSGPLLKNANPD